MSTVTPFRRTPKTDQRKVGSVYDPRITSSIRIDLEQIPPDRRRVVLWELLDQPRNMPATVNVGTLDCPDPELVWVLADAVARVGIYLHVEGAPYARRKWVEVVRGAVAMRKDGTQ